MENVSVNVDTMVVIKAFKIFTMHFDICNETNSLSLLTILEDIRLILVCAVLRIIFLYAIITTMKTFFFYCICRQKVSTSAWKFDKNNVRFV